MKYEYMVVSTIGGLIPKPEIVEEFTKNGYYVVSEGYMKSLLDEERELVRLKQKLKRGELIESNNPKRNN